MRGLPWHSVVICIFADYNKEELAWVMINHVSGNYEEFSTPLKLNIERVAQNYLEKKWTAGHHTNRQPPVLITEENVETIFHSLYDI